MFITVKGLNTEYSEQGTGYPVLLLHGWGSSRKFFQNIIDLLSEKYRVIALSFPSCDGTEKMKTPWNNTDYCDFVMEFLQKLNIENPILIGHSHGGRVIMELVGKKRTAPPKIIFLDAAGLVPKKSLKQKTKIAAFKTVKKILSLPLFFGKNEKLIEKARGHFGSADYKAADEVLRKTLVSLVNTDLRDLLCEIKCPSLLIWGENDTDTPLSDAKIIESRIADSGLCVIKNAGHFAFYEKPYEVLPIIKSFLL